MHLRLATHIICVANISDVPNTQLQHHRHLGCHQRLGCGRASCAFLCNTHNCSDHATTLGNLATVANDAHLQMQRYPGPQAMCDHLSALHHKLTCRTLSPQHNTWHIHLPPQFSKIDGGSQTTNCGGTQPCCHLLNPWHTNAIMPTACTTAAPHWLHAVSKSLLPDEPHTRNDVINT